MNLKARLRAWLVGIVREAIRAEAPPASPTMSEVLEAIAGAINEQAATAMKEPNDAPFAVAGSPRPAPWHIRRKELEAQHRTRRARLESFREEA